MANNWKIPKVLEDRIRRRDTRCVYCGKNFGSSVKDRATWEHIDNDASHVTEDNICLCCGSCNASKGVKMLEEWMNSDYCARKKMKPSTVSGVIRKALR